MQPTLNATVFIVDDDASVREALAWLLRTRRLLSDAYDSAEAFDRMAGDPGARLGAQPACLLLDVRMPGTSGLVLFERLAERSRRIRDELERASDALTQIGSAAERLTLSPNRPSPPSRRPGSTSRRETILTRREWEVLGHVTDGSTNRAIAERLAVSEDTVKTHMRNVLRKLRVTTRSAAVARYLAISGGMQ